MTKGQRQHPLKEPHSLCFVQDLAGELTSCRLSQRRKRLGTAKQTCWWGSAQTVDACPLLSVARTAKAEAVPAPSSSLTCASNEQEDSQMWESKDAAELEPRGRCTTVARRTTIHEGATSWWMTTLI